MNVNRLQQRPFSLLRGNVTQLHVVPDQGLIQAVETVRGRNGHNHGSACSYGSLM